MTFLLASERGGGRGSSAGAADHVYYFPRRDFCSPSPLQRKPPTSFTAKAPITTARHSPFIPPSLSLSLPPSLSPSLLHRPLFHPLTHLTPFQSLSLEKPFFTEAVSLFIIIIYFLQFLWRVISTAPVSFHPPGFVFFSVFSLSFSLRRLREFSPSVAFNWGHGWGLGP